MLAQKWGQNLGTRPRYGAEHPVDVRFSPAEVNTEMPSMEQFV